MHTTSPLEPGFYGLGIAPKLLEILWKNDYKEPTPIQRQSIPIAVEGTDMIGVAQTGTGKTLAYCIPMIQRLAQIKGRGLILLPTRELALQADETYERIGKPIGLRTAVLIGGASIQMQRQQLKKKPHVLIATPGRLNDLLQQNVLKLNDVGVLVLDEADRMLDMGFLPQITNVLNLLPKKRQTLLFSATMPEGILKIAGKYMQLPVQVEIARPGTASKDVHQELFIIPKSDKPRLLEKVLNDYRGFVLVFSRTKHGAKKLARLVRQMGHSSAEIHANRSLAQRKEALDGFKTGKYRVLVATDIAARGIDVKDIEIVVNYDLPDNPEDYVHRIGRTGRAGRKGIAISFATPDQRRDIRDIERLIRTPLKVSKQPDLPAARKLEKERTFATKDSRSSSRHTSKPSRGKSFSSKKSPRPSRGRGRSSGPRRKPRVHF